MDQIMFTADDLQQFCSFSTLSGTDLERLARTAADVYLGPGEFAVHEGGERALYAVVAGKVEVLKLIDGEDSKRPESRQ
jgi:thioredoxin reductase (NADPH)